ncbi:MAG: hypothetical protein IKX37_06225 [Bacteroidales bacterium]|nr:hypothetical protein [Bacteroidales bacterium]
MKTESLKLIASRTAYKAPENRIFSFRPEISFLATGNGSIPALDEGDVPDDLWG